MCTPFLIAHVSKLKTFLVPYFYMYFAYPPFSSITLKMATAIYAEILKLFKQRGGKWRKLKSYVRYRPPKLKDRNVSKRFSRSDILVSLVERSAHALVNSVAYTIILFHLQKHVCEFCYHTKWRIYVYFNKICCFNAIFMSFSRLTKLLLWHPDIHHSHNKNLTIGIVVSNDEYSLLGCDVV
jgi:hypothetical protein